MYVYLIGDSVSWHYVDFINMHVAMFVLYNLSLVNRKIGLFSPTKDSSMNSNEEINSHRPI